MSHDKLHKIDAVVSGFIHKANKKNEPLEAFRETDDFKKFEKSFSDAILKQAKSVAKNMPSWINDDTLNDNQFEAKFDQWLKDNMPEITEYVDEEDVLKVLVASFIFSIQSAYGRLGLIAKASEYVQFELTNPYYIDALNDQANYLLNRSKIDDTTRSRMITFIRDSRFATEDINELADNLAYEFEGISETRAFVIANTETNQAMSTAQQAFLKENGFQKKEWIPAGPSTCPTCQGNADQGPIDVDADFESGDLHPPAHPNCECYEDAGDEIDLDDVDVLWDGS